MRDGSVWDFFRVLQYNFIFHAKTLTMWKLKIPKIALRNQWTALNDVYVFKKSIWTLGKIFKNSSDIWKKKMLGSLRRQWMNAENDEIFTLAHGKWWFFIHVLYERQSS